MSYASLPSTLSHISVLASCVKRLLIGYFPSMTKIVDTLITKSRSVGVIL
ncbi:hypothetical protein Hanom_Chr02g00148511 [Helianthus anomalus]